MAVGSTALLVGGLALAAIGTGVQFVAGRQQAKAQEKQAEAQQRSQELQARRQRRQTLRQQRIARAELENQAAQVGAQGSSGELGGLSSLGAQAGAELGFINKTSLLGREFTQQGKRAASAASFGAIGGGIAGIGGSLFNFGLNQRQSSGQKTGFL